MNEREQPPPPSLAGVRVRHRQIMVSTQRMRTQTHTRSAIEANPPQTRMKYPIASTEGEKNEKTDRVLKKKKKQLKSLCSTHTIFMTTSLNNQTTRTHAGRSGRSRNDHKTFNRPEVCEFLMDVCVCLCVLKMRSDERCFNIPTTRSVHELCVRICTIA